MYKRQERYYSKVLSLPHSSAFFCLVCITLPPFSSFSLYVAPSFCRFLSTFVLARFCRYCRCSSRVAAVFPVPRPFVLLSVLLAVICARPLPFSVVFCFIVQQSQEACYLYVQQLHERQGHNQDLHRQNQGRRSGGQGLGQPPLHCYCSKRLWTATIDSILDTKKNTRSSEPPTSKSRPSRPRPSRTPSRTFKVRRILRSL